MFCPYLFLFLFKLTNYFLIKTGTQAILYFGIESDCCSFLFLGIWARVLFLFLMFSCFGELMAALRSFYLTYFFSVLFYFLVVFDLLNFFAHFRAFFQLFYFYLICDLILIFAFLFFLFFFWPSNFCFFFVILFFLFLGFYYLLLDCELLINK